VSSGFHAIGVGLGRALRSPLLLVGLWLTGTLAALPAGWAMVRILEQAMGTGRVQESMTRGFDAAWFDEYRDSAAGLSRSFDPSLIGVGAFLDNLERWVTGSLLGADVTLLTLAVAYALVWLFLLGGVFERYAEPERRPDPGRFFRACALHFPRFLRLTALSAALYFLAYRLLQLLLQRVEELTRDGTSESTLIAYSLLAWGLVAFLLTLIRMGFGFARAAIVVDGRKSAVLAALRGFGFVILHPGKAFALYYGMLVASGLLLVGYAFVAPGAGEATARAVLISFLVAQLFLLARLWVRLGLVAGQVELYRASRPAAPPPEETQTPSA
jgi:hypothetical protein